MKNKILAIIAIIVVLGIIGTLVYFIVQNNKHIKENAELTATNASIQAQLNEIGELTTVYEVYQAVKSGEKITEENLKPVTVPVSTTDESSITDIESLVGKYYKVDTAPGTILTTDLLMDDNVDVPKYQKDIVVTYFPLNTKPGDFVDFRALMANGEEYVICNHKEVQLIQGNVIQVNLSEEEVQIYNAASQDMAQYEKCMIIYCTRYLEPGNDTDTVAFYPVTHEMENIVQLNENIKDKTRCINSTLRDHIDQTLGILSIDTNSALVEAWYSKQNEWAASINTAQQQLNEQANEQAAQEEALMEEGAEVPTEEEGAVSPEATEEGAMDEGIE